MELLLVSPLLLGIIPGMIASHKGRSFFLWYLYGVLLFIIALVHVLLVAPRNVQQRELATGEYDKCPDCLELIRKGAKKCKHCGSLFNPVN